MGDADGADTDGVATSHDGFATVVDIGESREELGSEMLGDERIGGQLDRNGLGS